MFAIAVTGLYNLWVFVGLFYCLTFGIVFIQIELGVKSNHTTMLVVVTSVQVLKIVVRILYKDVNTSSLLSNLC